eukprot:1195788-Prorocentrum_minimum.AAC.7
MSAILANAPCKLNLTSRRGYTARTNAAIAPLPFAARRSGSALAQRSSFAASKVGSSFVRNNRKQAPMRSSNVCVNAAVSDYVLMINDVAGKMGTSVLQAARAKGIKVAPYCLTGPKREPMTVGDVTVEFFDSSYDR